ncbi:MAG: LysM peptidoglycan-binding domain-containing protein [Bacteroidales bacterium]|nr:LysM peptidoglycan-binding domain-containing protein [Bacteroidales bacterium]
MKLLNKILLTFGTGLAAGLSLQAQSVLDVSNASLSPTVVLPQSFETDTKKMLEDWYLRNYAVLDYDADSRGSESVSDQVLLERLSALPTEIEMPLNAPVKSVINFYVNRKKQLVENMLGLSLYYMPIFEEALERHGMPLELKYLPVIESALVPTAVSRAGASGLWQFMPGTATGLGLEVNSLVDQRRDPYLSSEAGARYLKQLYNTYHDWSLAIAAYNCGPGNVNKALRRAGEGKHDFWDIYPYLPTETRGYVPSFIAANYVMTYHKDHGISPALAKRPLITDTIHVNQRVHFDQISEVLGIPVEEIRALNPQFRKDMIPGDIRPYSLVLPSLQVYAYIANEDSILNHNASKYARRGIVEPATGGAVGRDSKGEYYEEEIVQYHTVKRGETFTKIAKKYGITVAALRKANPKMGKSAKAGKKLKIVTTRRRYKPVATPLTTGVVATGEAPATSSTANDTIDEKVTLAPLDTVSGKPMTTADAPAPKAEVKATEPKKETPKQTTNAKQSTTTKKETTKKPAASTAKKNITHTVAKGESLSKIAQKYGTSVAKIKLANKLKNDNINAGQKLVIPAK